MDKKDSKIAYPIVILNLTNKEIIISTEEYNYDILILNTNDLSKIHHMTKIAIILADLETNTQIEKVLELIRNLRENEIIPIVFSENNVPEIIRNTTLVVNNASIDDLKLFLKIIDLLVFKICLVCTDFNDVVEFLKSSTGEIILYKKENIPFKEALKYVQKDLSQNKAQKSIILIDMGYGQNFYDAEELISNINALLKSEKYIYQVCLNVELKENMTNLYLVVLF